MTSDIFTNKQKNKKPIVIGHLSSVRCSRSAFTLIETLIYITIISLAVSSFVLFSISIASSRNKTYVTQEVQANMRVALEIISQRIRAANAVNVGASTFDSDPGVLFLAMDNSIKNPTLIQLNQDDGRLEIVEGVGNPIFATSDKVKITNLMFTNLTSSGERENIRIQMTAIYNNTNNDPAFNATQSVQTTVSLRQ